MRIDYRKKMALVEVQPINFEAFPLRPSHRWALVDFDLKSAEIDFAGRRNYLPPERVIGP